MEKESCSTGLEKFEGPARHCVEMALRYLKIAMLSDPGTQRDTWS
jgi:hypothetical protein